MAGPHEDVVEESNPRPSGHVCKVCTHIMEDDDFEESTDKDVLDTTHQIDIGVWEVDKDPPNLMETANAGCMRSPRQGSFGRVQFQGETPGLTKCCWRQRCDNFWLWYETRQGPKKGSQVKRLTRQQQKRCDLLSYSLMIIFVLSNVILESNVASVSEWNLGPDAGVFDLQMMNVVLGEHRSFPVFWNKDDNCGNVLTTDNGFEEDNAFLQSDNIFEANVGNVLPLEAPPVPIRKGCEVQVGHWDPTATEGASRALGSDSYREFSCNGAGLGPMQVGNAFANED